VRPSRTTAASGKPYTPDETLIDQALGLHPDLPLRGKFPFKRATFVDAMAAFGPLPERGQCELINCLIKLFVANQFVANRPLVRRVAASALRDRVESIEQVARKFLSLLGVDTKGAEFLRRWEGCQSGRDQSRDVRIAIKENIAKMAMLQLTAADLRCHGNLGAADSRLTNFILELLWFQRLAKAAFADSSKHTLPGRGGARARPRPHGALIRDAIEVYVYMRKHYPNSGSEPGYGPPMLTFIRAVAALVDATVTDAAIKEVWRPRKSKSK
jgi:hypothetical protein